MCVYMCLYVHVCGYRWLRESIYVGMRARSHGPECVLSPAAER